MLLAPINSIFNSASTGAGSLYELGKEGTPGKAAGIGSPQVILQFITAGTFTVDVEASLDGTNFFNWVDAFSDTDGDALIIDNAPIYLRINTTAISGNLQVLAQKFISQ